MEPTPTGSKLLASQDFGRVQPKAKGRNIIRAMNRARCGLALPSKIDLFQVCHWSFLDLHNLTLLRREWYQTVEGLWWQNTETMCILASSLRVGLFSKIYLQYSTNLRFRLFILLHLRTGFPHAYI